MKDQHARDEIASLRRVVAADARTDMSRDQVLGTLRRQVEQLEADLASLTAFVGAEFVNKPAYREVRWLREITT